MNEKTIIFDIDKDLNRYLTAKTDDKTGARKFIFKLVENNKIFNLDNLIVKIAGKKPDGKNILIDCKIIGDGVIEFGLTTQMLIKEGVLSLELVFYKDLVELSSNSFEIFVKKSARDYKSIESSDEYGTLVALLKKIDTWDKYFEEASGHIEEKYCENLNNKINVEENGSRKHVKSLVFKVTSTQSSGSNNIKVSPSMGLKLI